MAKETQVVLPLHVTIPQELIAKVRTTLFCGERDNFIKEVKANAARVKTDVFVYYAQLLLQQALESRYEYATSKVSARMEGAVSVLMAQGKTESEARKMLGLGE